MKKFIRGDAICLHVERLSRKLGHTTTPTEGVPVDDGSVDFILSRAVAASRGRALLARARAAGMSGRRRSSHFIAVGSRVFQNI